MNAFMNIFLNNLLYFLVYLNDVKRIRNLTRYFVYKFENFEYYRLISARALMMQHKYVNKEKIAKEQELNKDEEWRWVFHLKP